MSTTEERAPERVAPPRPAATRLQGLRAVARGTRVGRLATAGVVALVLLLLAGVLGVVAATRTGAAASDAVGSSGPVRSAAQALYRSLSDADAVSAQAFLPGPRTTDPGDPAGPDALRRRYLTDVTVAGAALAVVARADPGTADGAAGGSAVAVLSTGLPVYTGVVETARTADAQGLSVGGAYLREASSFLQTVLLPAARTVYDAQSATLQERQDTADGDAWSVLAVLAALAALVALIGLHRRVARTTHRRRTPGLAVAAGAVALLLVWEVVALGAASVLVGRARDDGVAPDRAVVAVQFAVLQSRSDEIVTLVSRGSSTGFEAGYVARGITVFGFDGLLDRAQAAAGADPEVVARLEEARRSGRLGLDVHSRVRSLDVAGNFDAATALALSSAPGGGFAVATRVESALDAAVAATGARARADGAAAAAAPTGLAAGAVLLVLVALAGLAAGLAPRLQEYR